MENILTTLVSIGIATKDRKEVLLSSIREMESILPKTLTVLIFDDASAVPISKNDFSSYFNVIIFRSFSPMGQAHGRNFLVQKCSTPYFLQLDDDSYLKQGNLLYVIEKSQSIKDGFAFALPFDEPTRGKKVLDFHNIESVPVRRFVGCSALLDVKRFLDLGGYDTFFEGYGEEDEFSIRAFKSGYNTYRIGGVLLQHNVTNVSRDKRKIILKTYRNLPYMWCTHAPNGVLILRLFKLFFQVLSVSVSLRTFKVFSAFKNGVHQGLNNRKIFSPLTINEYKTFFTLPSR